MSGIYGNDDFEIKRTLKKFGITMTMLAKDLKISRVTLTKSKKVFSENGRCVNRKCNVFFSRLKNMVLISKERILNEIELVTRLDSNLELLQHNINVNDLEIITDGLEMINNIYKDKNDISEVENKRIDVVLKKVTKIHNRYFDGQNDGYERLIGKTVVMSRDTLDILSGRNWKRDRN